GEVKVGPAHAAGQDAQQRLAGRGPRVGNLPQLQRPLRSGEDHRTHRHMIAGPLALGRPATLESMPQRTDSLDLGGLRLSPGEGRRLQLHPGHDPLVLSGQHYSIEPASLPVTLDISRMTAGGYA